MIVGVLLVYIPLMGDYITATVLGGAKGNMVGQLVASQFQTAQNWALGSAMAVMLIVIILLSVAVIGGALWLDLTALPRAQPPRPRGGAAMTAVQSDSQLTPDAASRPAAASPLRRRCTGVGAPSLIGCSRCGAS